MTYDPVLFSYLHFSLDKAFAFDIGFWCFLFSYRQPSAVNRLPSLALFSALNILAVQQ